MRTPCKFYFIGRPTSLIFFLVSILAHPLGCKYPCCGYILQGEYYVPVRQTEAVMTLSISLWLIFLLSTEILCFLHRKNTF